MVKAFFQYLIVLILVVSCTGNQSLRMPASDHVLDVVFDLDYTLIAQVKSPEGIPESELLVFEHEFYRLQPGARELIAKLLDSSRVRLSFFSGGGKERNASVLKQVEVGGQSLYDLAYKVLNREHLTDVSHLVAPNARFSERYKKDLRLVNPDLSKVIMIDDNYLFAPEEAQRKNFLWLGETFENVEVYDAKILQKIEYKYRPKSYVSWLGSRLKLSLVSEILAETLETSTAQWDFEKLQALAKESELENSRWSNFKSMALPKLKLAKPNSCMESAQLLLLN